MLNKIMEQVKEFAGKRERFDPSRFNDQVALQTGWGPVKNDGINFRTHSLSKKDDWQIAFKPTIGAILFSGIFIAVSIGLISLAIIADTKGEWSMNLLILLFGLVFGGIGGGMLYKFTTPIIFDKQSGTFRKGRKSPTQVQHPGKIKQNVWLANIHALQIISEYCRSRSNNGGSSYRSYELNLVLDDSKRINVIDHGNYARLRKDAESLAEFLGVPLWDRI
ncbi:MAG: hypothetical protein R6V06_07100 [Kiritimatiellia bacterium]